MYTSLKFQTVEGENPDQQTSQKVFSEKSALDISVLQRDATRGTGQWRYLTLSQSSELRIRLVGSDRTG